MQFSDGTITPQDDFEKSVNAIAFEDAPIIKKKKIKVSIVWNSTNRKDTIIFDYLIGLNSIHEEYQGFMKDSAKYGATIEHMEVL